MSNNKQVFAFELMCCFSIIYNRINAIIHLLDCLKNLRLRNIQLLGQPLIKRLSKVETLLESFSYIYASANFCVLSIETDLASNSVCPIRNRSISLAASLPSEIAQTTKDCPLRISPAVKTLGLLVW